MLLKNEYEYNLVYPIPIEEIVKSLEDKDISIDVESNSNKWYAFGVYYGLKNNFNIETSKNFGYMLSAFYTGIKIPQETTEYMNNKLIYSTIDREFSILSSELADEKLVAKDMFQKIYDIYNNVEKYENKTESKKADRAEREYLDLENQ